MIVYGLNKFCSVLSYTKSFLTCLLMLIYIYVSIIRSSRPSYPKPTSFQICFLFMCEGKIRMIVPRNCCWKGEYNFKNTFYFLTLLITCGNATLSKQNVSKFLTAFCTADFKLITKRHLSSQDMF